MLGIGNFFNSKKNTHVLGFVFLVKIKIRRLCAFFNLHTMPKIMWHTMIFPKRMVAHACPKPTFQQLLGYIMQRVLINRNYDHSRSFG